jgi:hypothetical protein
MRAVLLVMALGTSTLALACGPAPSGHGGPRAPSGAVRVVPADQVKGTCRCDDDDDDDDDDDEPAPRRPIEYVKLSDWQPPPQVAQIEAAVPPRGDEPALLTTFPQLTLHRPIDNTGYRRLGRYPGVSDPGGLHAR